MSGLRTTPTLLPNPIGLKIPVLSLMSNCLGRFIPLAVAIRFEYNLFSPVSAMFASQGIHGMSRKLQVAGTNPNVDKEIVPLHKFTTKSV